MKSYTASSSRSEKDQLASFFHSFSNVDCSTCNMKFWQYCSSGVGRFVNMPVCASSSQQALPILTSFVSTAIAGSQIDFLSSFSLPFTAYTVKSPVVSSRPITFSIRSGIRSPSSY